MLLTRIPDHEAKLRSRVGKAQAEQCRDLHNKIRVPAAFSEKAGPYLEGIVPVHGENSVAQLHF